MSRIKVLIIVFAGLVLLIGAYDLRGFNQVKSVVIFTKPIPAPTPVPNPLSIAYMRSR